MYDTYKAIYKLSKLDLRNKRTFVLLELLSQLKIRILGIYSFLTIFLKFRGKQKDDFMENFVC